MLQIHLFGRPQLRYDRAAFPFRAPERALSVLAYLLLHPGKPLARDAVAASLWPEASERQARAKLRTHLHYLLRGGLPASGTPWILADKRTVRWNPDAPAWADAVAFEHLAALPESQEEAAGLYAGDLMEAFEDEWLQAPRKRLRELQEELLAALVRRHRSAGRPGRAMEFANRLRALDPWREDAVRAVMALKLETGDRAGAMQTYRDLAMHLADELGVAPMPETTAAYEQLSSGEVLGAAAPLRTAPPRSVLPAYLTSFVDRELEVRALRQSLSDRRLVTLTGTGGVGKTRLAVEAARELVDRFTDGVWVVELGSLADEELIVPAIAGVLGLVQTDENALIAWLSDRETLIVLDNCEHLPAVAAIAQRLLQSCAGLRILATSREPLRITGEYVERVPSLPTPVPDGPLFPSFAQLRDTPSVRLFLERVADVSPAFAMRDDSEADCRALVTIARRLDGIPLAIELAAARASSLPIGVLAERLEDRFYLLTGSDRTALPRHQTLRATLDWSYESLSDGERTVFARCGVFSGGWTSAAAQAVCTLLPAWQLEDVLGTLVDKSLVLVDNRGVEPRYTMLESMRDYAVERLEKLGERGQANALHAAYFAALANEDARFGSRLPSWIGALTPEVDNLRAAMSWAIHAGNDVRTGAALATAFGWYANVDPMLIEAANWCTDALAALGDEPDPQLEAPLRLALARCDAWLLHHEDAVKASERAMNLFRALSRPVELVLAMYFTARCLSFAGRAEKARVYADEALRLAQEGNDLRSMAYALHAKARLTQEPRRRDMLMLSAAQAFRAIGNPHGAIAALADLAESRYAAGDYAAALREAKEALTYLSEDVEMHWADIVLLRCNAAAYALAVRDVEAARTFAQGAVELGYRIGDHRIGWAFGHLSFVALARGDLTMAAKLLGASNKQYEKLSWKREPTEEHVYVHVLQTLQRALPQERIDGLIREGSGWRTAQAVAASLAV